MRVLTKVMVTALALPASVIPAGTPGYAAGCPGTVTFLSGAPTTSPPGRPELVATFEARGPGYTPHQCEDGYISTCQMYEHGHNLPTTCRTDWTDPSWCDAARPCVVTARATGYAWESAAGYVRVVVGITWGRMGGAYGPEAIGEGEWWINGHSDPDCRGTLAEVCRIVRDNPIEID